MKSKLFVLLGSLVFLGWCRGGNAQENSASEKLFLLRCAGCHTIGGGDATGPDLKNAPSMSPAELEKAVRSMEEKSGPLSEEEIFRLVAFLKDPKAAEKLRAAEEELRAKEEGPLEPPDPRKGKLLFEGKSLFRNKGTACIACHGTPKGENSLGGDLFAIAADRGEESLVRALEKPLFPVMRALYAEKPLTRMETRHVAAYLKSAAEPQQQQNEQGKFPDPVATGAVAGLGVIGFLGILYHRRFSKSSR